MEARTLAIRYLYHCAPCEHEWDVIKPVKAIDDPETCPKCQASDNYRVLGPVFINGANDWNSQGWDPALGCYVRSNHHRRQIARDRGLEEIGNEKPDTVHRSCERTLQDNLESSWAKA